MKLFLFLILLTSNVLASELEIYFVADPNYSESVIEYRKIWEDNRESIIELLESSTGLIFSEKSNRIKAILIDGVSSSGAPFKAPMRLRYNYSNNVKLATLIHEMGHRLIYKTIGKYPQLDSHKILFLFLYDVWFDLKGKAFADQMVEVEKRRSERYRKTWEEVLNSTRMQRSNKLNNYIRP